MAVKKFLDENGFRYFAQKLDEYPNNEVLIDVINAIDEAKADTFEDYIQFGPGDHAVSENNNTTANGDNSHAEGDSTEANGVCSHAEGQNSYATNEAAHAEGKYTVASGDATHSEGYNTVASGDSSHSEGKNTKAVGANSHAGGYRAKTLGGSSFAHGGAISYNTEILLTGDANATTYTMGTNKVPRVNSIIVDQSDSLNWTFVTGISGSSITLEKSLNPDEAWTEHLVHYNLISEASGYASFAEGYSLASGQAAHAEGGYSVSSGSTSHAEGYGTQATGNYSHAEGYFTQATGPQTHAEGYSSQATVQYAHAEGYQCKATHDAAHAEGYQCEATGQYSHAEGQGNKIAAKYAHVEGYNNLITSTAASGSHTEGNTNTNTASSGHAEGYKNTITANNGHVEGKFGNNASNAGHVEGIGGYAGTKDAAHAEGGYSISSGIASHAEGGGLIGKANGWVNVTVVANTNNLQYTVGGSSASGMDNYYSCSENLELIDYNTTYNNHGSISQIDYLLFLCAKGKTLYVNNASALGSTLSNQITTLRRASFDPNTNIITLEGPALSSAWTKMYIFTGPVAIGNGSHAENVSYSKGDWSHAEGYNTAALEDYSHAEGMYTMTGNIPSGSIKPVASHAEGLSSYANGIGAHAEGIATVADGYASHATGYKTKAYHNTSIASGIYTENNGLASMVSGIYSSVDSAASIAVGLYNKVAANAENSLAIGGYYLGTASFSKGAGGSNRNRFTIPADFSNRNNADFIAIDQTWLREAASNLKPTGATGLEDSNRFYPISNDEIYHWAIYTGVDKSGTTIYFSPVGGYMSVPTETHNVDIWMISKVSAPGSIALNGANVTQSNQVALTPYISVKDKTLTIGNTTINETQLQALLAMIT